MTAAAFEEQYGDLVRRDFSKYTTARTLKTALENRQPPIRVSDGLLKVWLAKTGLPEGAVKVSSCAELQEHYGDVLEVLAAETSSSYTLCSALKKRTPPVYVTDGVAKQWFKRCRGDLQWINYRKQVSLQEFQEAIKVLDFTL